MSKYTHCRWWSTYIDLSLPKNRKQILDQVNLETNGAQPTGQQPIIYLDNTIDWQENPGTGKVLTPKKYRP